MVSVIMPAYNAEGWIGRAIDSLLEQSYCDWELCVVDDASTDRTVDIVKEYADKDYRIHIEINEENKGCGLARRGAIAMASGDVYAFLDSDDWVDSKMFEDLLLVMEMEDADVAVCGVYNYSEGKYVGQSIAEKYHTLSKEDLYRAYMDGIYVMQFNGNKLYRKEVIDKVEYADMRFCEDSTTTYKWLWEANKAVIVPKSYYHYWQHEDSNSNSKNSQLVKSYDTVRCVYDHYKFCKQNGYKDLHEKLARFCRTHLIRCIHEFDMNSEEYLFCDEVRNEFVKYYKEEDHDKCR